MTKMNLTYFRGSSVGNELNYDKSCIWQTLELIHNQDWIINRNYRSLTVSFSTISSTLLNVYSHTVKNTQVKYFAANFFMQ